MSADKPTALIADDEPLLRRALARLLASAWPALQIVAQARNGREAVALFEAHEPDICFLDVHMPGLSGVEAARQIGRRAQLVFVTAFDQYALQAFNHGALDYLVKPLEPVRLAETVQRLQERLQDRARAAQPTPQALALSDALLEQLAAHLQKGRPAASPMAAAAPANSPPLRWIRALVGSALRLIAVDEIDFLRSDEKYTLIAWRGDGGKAGEALIRMPLKELLAQLDAEHFVQVHRSVVVNLRSIDHVTRGLNETADIHLKGRNERLPVSRSYLHLFKQM
jgi:DNA-binding LytR/AlgR family response regulator